MSQAVCLFVAVRGHSQIQNKTDQRGELKVAILYTSPKKKKKENSILRGNITPTPCAHATLKWHVRPPVNAAVPPALDEEVPQLQQDFSRSRVSVEEAASIQLRLCATTPPNRHFGCFLPVSPDRSTCWDACWKLFFCTNRPRGGVFSSFFSSLTEVDCTLRGAFEMFLISASLLLCARCACFPPVATRRGQTGRWLKMFRAR